MNKIRCRICKHLFTPKQPNHCYCSDKCRRIADHKRITESNNKLKEKRLADRKRMEKDGIMSPVEKGKRKPLTDPVRYPNGKMTSEQISEVKRIMKLPTGKRWAAGAKDWGFLERNLAKRIDRENNRFLLSERA